MGIRLTVWATLVAAAASTGACDVKEPKPACTVSPTTFAAKYTLVSGTGDCAMLPGETLGVQAYSVDPVSPGDGLESMAIESLDVGTAYNNALAASPPVVDPTAGHEPYALGKFTTVKPGDDDVCGVPVLAPAQLDLPAVPAPAGGGDDGGAAGGDGGPGGDDGGAGGDDGGAAGGQPALDVKYEWSDVRVHVTAELIGIEWTGSLTYTNAGCTAKYTVTALAPAVSCDSGSGTPDPTMCNEDNGINSGVDATCDPQLLLCVLAKSSPF